MMKISLFIKPSIIKVCFCLMLVIYSFSQPNNVSAGFFSDLFTKVLGSETQASKVLPIDNTEVVHNSQTLPLPESSVNPDLKSIKDVPITTIVSDEALISTDGPLGTDTDLEKYASTEKINVYIVKKGDTLDSIAKKLKVSKDTIISSNADLKKSDLLKIGQSLVVLALKSQVEVKDTPIEKAIAKKKDISIENKPDIKEVKKVNQDNSLETQEVKALPIPIQPVQLEQPNVEQIPPTPAQTPLTESPSGQPKGTIDGGYIWPFPKGVGRVSQGLHADQAYDFSAPKDTPIFAVQDGVVFIAHPTGYNGGYGKYVVINFNDGRQAIFGHMNKVAAEVGQVVKQGDVIGYVGTTGHSTGYHTHIGFHGGLPNPYIGLKVNSTDVIDND